MKQLGYMDRCHADTAVTDRLTDISLLRSPVDVDVSGVGILVLFLGALQPENTGNDRISSRGIWFQNLSGPLS